MQTEKNNIRKYVWFLACIHKTIHIISLSIDVIHKSQMIFPFFLYILSDGMCVSMFTISLSLFLSNDIEYVCIFRVITFVSKRQTDRNCEKYHFDTNNHIKCFYRTVGMGSRCIILTVRFEWMVNGRNWKGGVVSAERRYRQISAQCSPAIRANKESERACHKHYVRFKWFYVSLFRSRSRSHSKPN